MAPVAMEYLPAAHSTHVLESAAYCPAAHTTGAGVVVGSGVVVVVVGSGVVEVVGTCVVVVVVGSSVVEVVGSGVVVVVVGSSMQLVAAPNEYLPCAQSLHAALPVVAL